MKRRDELREQLLAAMRTADGDPRKGYQVRMLMDDQKLEQVITDELLHRYSDFLTSKRDE